MLGRIVLALCLILNMAASFAQSDLPNVAQLHIRMKPQALQAPKTMMSASEAAVLSAAAGVTLTPNAVMADKTQIVGLPRAMTRAEAWAIAAKLSAQPDIEHVQPIDPEFNKRPPAKPPLKINAGAQP